MQSRVHFTQRLPRRQLAATIRQHLLMKLHRVESLRHIDSGDRHLAVWAWDTTSREVMVRGVADAPVLEVLFSWLERATPGIYAATAVDAGAHVGNHSIQLAQRFSRVRSFEANPATFQLLQVYVSSLPNVEPQWCALSECVGEGRLEIRKTNLGGSFITGSANDSAIPVPLSRLDDLIPPDEDVSFMKLDVEGHEAEVLRGSARIIDAWKPVIALEVGRGVIRGGSSDSIEYLKSCGYRTFLCVQQRGVSHAFGKALRLLVSALSDADSVWDVVQLEFPLDRSYPLLIAIHDGFPLGNSDCLPLESRDRT